MVKWLLCIIYLLFAIQGYAQKNSCVDSLCVCIAHCKTDSEKVIRMGNLAAYYFEIKNDVKADSLAHLQMYYAEQTHNNRLIARVLLDNADYYLIFFLTMSQLNKAENYINHALDISKEHHLQSYTALAYMRLNILNRLRGTLDIALKYGMMSYTLSEDIHNDSVHVLCALELGNTYQKKKDVMTAFHTYSHTQELCQRKNMFGLLSQTYIHFASLYDELGDMQRARDLIFKSIDLDKKYSNKINLVNDYLQISRMSDFETSKQYLDLVLKLSDAQNMIPYRIEAYKKQFGTTILQGQSTQSLDYLNAHPDLIQYYKHIGPKYYETIIGEVYLYSGNYNDAIRNFKSAMPYFDSLYTMSARQEVYEGLSEAYQQLGQYTEAILYYHKAITCYAAGSNLRAIMQSYKALEDIYNKTDDIKSAYKAHIIYDKYKDSLLANVKEKEIALGEIDTENKRLLQAEDEAHNSLERKYNLEYMGITIFIIMVFSLLLFMGFVKINAFTVRLMGFMAFIFLFEFIILLADNYIHHITNGEPWKVWLIKIGLLSVLLPAHEYLEHRITHYIISHKPAEIRKKWIEMRRKNKAQTPTTDKEPSKAGKTPADYS